jgi:hypothetical protein
MVEHFGCRIAESHIDVARRSVGVDECVAVDFVMAFQPMVKRASVSWMAIGSGFPGDIIKSYV